tara:strand:- start:8 stop:1210 length:1203 start_codon:yes stop_codon:yes gene_type:complete
MTNPKLALIPSGYKSGKVYSILPSDGSGDFDFDRASTATRINAQGLIEEVASGENRLNYSLLDGEVVGCPHLLLEPSRTNLVQYSEDFSQWNLLSFGTGTNPVITSNNAISPDGTQNADKIVFNSGSGTTSGDSSQINYIVSITSGTDATASIYLKGENGGEELVFRGVADGSYQKITLTTEWQRFSITENSGTTTDAITFGIRQNVSGLGVINSTATIYAFGAQIETGSYSTSLIKTDGGQVTRAAETCYGSGNATIFNDAEGVLYAEIRALSDDGTGRNLGISDGTTSNRILILYSPNSNELRFYLAGSGGSITVNHTLTEVTEFIKVALKYKAQDFGFYVNGVEVDTNTSNITFSGLDDLSFNNPFDGGTSNFYGNVKDLRYFDRALTDAELTELTT